MVAVEDTVGLGVPFTKLFGPVHEYTDMAVGPPVNIIGNPTQTGPLFEAVTTGVVFTVTFVVLAALVPQPFAAVTLTFPLWAEAERLTVIEFVFAPLVIVQPVGKVQL